MSEISLLLALVREALNQQGKTNLDDSFEEDKMIKLILDQEIVSMVWPTIAKQEKEKFKCLAKCLEESYNMAIYKALMQQLDIQEVLTLMEEKGKECLPLKGWIMRNYYPAAEMRSMTDFDVLMKEFDYKELQEIMESLGYEPDMTDDEQHDIYIKKPYTVIELHKRLSDYETEQEAVKIDEWLESIWNRCKSKKDSECIYELTNEDFYIYHLIHMYKHFKISGCGIRPLIDIYVFLSKFEDILDWKYLDDMLCQIELEKFEKTMRVLCRKCFSLLKDVLEKEDKKLVYFMVSDGLFGSEQTNAANRMMRSGKNNYAKSKLAAMVKIAFPPMDGMNKRYPVLKKCPWLLPVLWIVRIVESVLGGNRRLKAFVKGSSKEEYNKIEEIYKIAGIK